MEEGGKVLSTQRSDVSDMYVAVVLGKSEGSDMYITVLLGRREGKSHQSSYTIERVRNCHRRVGVVYGLVIVAQFPCIFPFPISF